MDTSSNVDLHGTFSIIVPTDNLIKSVHDSITDNILFNPKVHAQFNSGSITVHNETLEFYYPYVVFKFSKIKVYHEPRITYNY